MPAYQFYRLAHGGVHSEPASMILFDDRAAVRRALGEEFPDGCDVWQGQRFVGRLHKARPEERGDPSVLPDVP
jgi:hypothetical protein